MSIITVFHDSKLENKYTDISCTYNYQKLLQMMGILNHLRRLVY